MVTQSVAVRHKSRFTYCILALFLGTLGVHNFYAGYNGRGIAQLLLTMSFLAAEAPEAVGVIFIWAIIEMIITNRDSDGILLI
jgi:TM2 domain-containing membrane protein YozV